VRPRTIDLALHDIRVPIIIPLVAGPIVGTVVMIWSPHRAT